MMRMMYCFFLLCTIQNWAFAQKPISNDVDISPAQLKSFQEQAEEKKELFISCVEIITRNHNAGIREDNIKLGMSLFEDTAHIQVSNVRTNSLTPYSVKNYFNNVVRRYYSQTTLTVIEFKSSKVTIDEKVMDKNGNCIALRGHFEFEQIFERCKERVLGNTEIPQYRRCYRDVTKKIGLITIKPVNMPTGITWTVLLSGIKVKSTKER